ncbi:MAG: hypothetical protein ACHQK8_03515, partial [Bacteroidia bacterium]
IDQDNHPNPNVKYLFCSSGLNVQLRKNGFSYDTYHPSKSPQRGDFSKSLPNFENKFPPSGVRGPDSIFFHRVDIDFINANPNPQIIAEQPSEDYANYYTTGTPEEGILNVRTFQKVIYKNLYDEIDLEFLHTPSPAPRERGAVPREGNSLPFGESQRGVKFNFIIHPGADASQIRWKYNGAFSTSLRNGKII